MYFYWPDNARAGDDLSSDGAPALCGSPKFLAPAFAGWVSVAQELMPVRVLQLWLRYGCINSLQNRTAKSARATNGYIFSGDSIPKSPNAATSWISTRRLSCRRNFFLAASLSVRMW